jgi:hypothetical protein
MEGYAFLTCHKQINSADCRLIEPRTQANFAAQTPLAKKYFKNFVTHSFAQGTWE